jgi:ligand-binding sensor domain-containing protein
MIVEFQCCAQSNYRFRHFDSDDGLPSKVFSAVRQDSLGFIWTFHNDGLSSGGLTRFDGFNFKVYDHDPDDSLSSPGAWIDRIEIEPKWETYGNTWYVG